MIFAFSFQFLFLSLSLSLYLVICHFLFLSLSLLLFLSLSISLPLPPSLSLWLSLSHLALSGSLFHLFLFCCYLSTRSLYIYLTPCYLSPFSLPHRRIRPCGSIAPRWPLLSPSLSLLLSLFLTSTTTLQHFFPSISYSRSDSHNTVPPPSLQTLWLERSILTTASEFPGILRWFEIEHTETQMLSPVETAIDMVENKNREMEQLIAEYNSMDRQNGSPSDCNPLSMTLKGVVDAAVNGGITKYKEVSGKACPIRFLWIK